MKRKFESAELCASVRRGDDRPTPRNTTIDDKQTFFNCEIQVGRFGTTGRGKKWGRNEIRVS